MNIVIFVAVMALPCIVRFRNTPEARRQASRDGTISHDRDLW